jgi:hypothetical protein
LTKISGNWRFECFYAISQSWRLTISNISKLQLVLNFACRIITNTRKYDHITPALRELNWLPVKEQLLYRDSVVTFKCMNSLAPSYLCNYFYKRSSVHSRLTRNNNYQIQIPLCKTASGQRSFRYRAAKLWNNLEDSTKDIKSLKLFKKTVKAKILDNFLNDI